MDVGFYLLRLHFEMTFFPPSFSYCSERAGKIVEVWMLNDVTILDSRTVFSVHAHTHAPLRVCRVWRGFLQLYL